MSNRRKSTAPTDVRTALLAALDVEYERATRRKDLPRMQEIATIVQQLKGVWQDIQPDRWDAVLDTLPQSHGISLDLLGIVDAPPAPRSEPVESVPLPVATPQPPEPEAPVAPPEPTQEPASLPLPISPPLFMTDLMPLQGILARAEREPEPQSDQEERRREARARVRDAANEANRALADGRILYEQALMAKNTRIAPMSELQEAARMQGFTVEQLADRLIAEYDRKGRRTIYVYTRQTKAIRDIDASDGALAEEIATQAVRDIIEDDDA